MHETMVAQSLLTSISAETVKHDAKPISAKISCGTLNAVNEEILCFAFEAIAKGTPCEGMKLHVEIKPIQSRCKNCSEEFPFEIHRPSCPICGDPDFELLPDAPLILEEIEFEGD